MPTIPVRAQQPNPVSPQVELPPEFPQIPQEVLDRFQSAKDWQARLDEFWGRTRQAVNDAQTQAAQYANARVVYSVDSFLIYAKGGIPQPMFALDSTGVKLGDVLVVNTPGRKVYIGAGVYANDNTPFYIDTLGRFSLGANLTWNPDTSTLAITGIINATSGTIGGFDIGADYIRDSINSFGLASTVTGGDDVRFWAGDTFANRATAPIHITEDGLLTARKVFLSDVAGTDNRFIQWQTSGVARWTFFCNSAAESGANAGSNLVLSNYSDAGAYLGDVFSVDRASRGMLFPENLITMRWNGIGVTSTIKIALDNQASATNVLNQWSPALSIKGDGWRTNSGGSRVNCNWKMEVQPVTGTANPYNPLVFSSDVSDSPTYVARVTFDSTGIQANIGATTPGTGAFTTLSATGVVTISAGSVGSPSLIPSGDTNTGLWFPAADTVAFSTAGTERLRIVSGGNVGIGVTPETEPKLHIAKGSAGTDPTWTAPDVMLVENTSGTNCTIQIFTSNAAAGSIQFSDTDARGRGNIAYLHSTDEMQFQTAATLRVSISSAGAVTIANLAGVGTRTVVADANGVLSAP